MRFARAGSGVVGRYKHSKVLARFLKPIYERWYYFFVNLLYRINFMLNIAVVSALVGRFHMDIHKVQPA